MPNGGDLGMGNDTGTAIVTDKEEEGSTYGAMAGEVTAQPQNQSLTFISNTVGGFSFPKGFVPKNFGNDTGGIVQGTSTSGIIALDIDTNDENYMSTESESDNKTAEDTVDDMPNSTTYDQDVDTSVSNRVAGLVATGRTVGTDNSVSTEENTTLDTSSTASGSPGAGISIANDSQRNQNPISEAKNNSTYSVVYDGLVDDTKLDIDASKFLPATAKIDNIDKLAAEGISQHRPEIVAMTQFHSMFKETEATDNISNEFLNVVADPSNLRSLPAARLMEIQTYVRNLTSKNTRDILKIFNNRYNNGSRDIKDIGQFFKDMVALNNETRFLDNVKYDLIQDEYDINEVIQEAARSGNSNQMRSVLNANKDNTYVRMIIRYLIINNLAHRFFVILSLINRYKEDFMLDFYDDVIIGAQIDDSEIKEVFDSRSLSMTLSDHPVRDIIREDLPNSINLIRIIKALHASCMGFICFPKPSKIYHDEEPAAFYNIASGFDSRDFLLKGRMLMYEDIFAPYRPSTNHNSDYQDHITQDNRDTYLDLGVRLDQSTCCDVLVTLLYDMKNAARDNQGSKSHSTLLSEHIASSGIKNFNGFLGEDYLDNPDLLDFLDSNSAGGYPNLSAELDGSSAQAQLDNPVYPNTHSGKLIYKESEMSPGKKVLLIDGQNGLIPEEAKTNNLITASDEFFNVESIAAGQLANAVEVVRENVEAIIEDIKQNYGLIEINQNASHPKNYVENFCDRLAAQLEKIKNASTADKPTLLQALLLTRAGENFDFCFDLFVATLGVFHEANYGTGEKDVYTQEGLTGDEGEIETSAPIKDYKNQAPILEAAGVDKETISSSGFNDTYEGGHGLYHSPFDKVFANYYRYLIPSSLMTVGDNDPADYYQVYVDSAYKHRDKDIPRPYDGDTWSKYLWDENSDPTHVSVGNDDFIEVTKPASATHHNDFCQHSTFNVAFKAMIEGDFNLITLPFSHDKEFLAEILSNANKTNNIAVDSLNNVITVNGFKSSNLTRIYKLFKIMCGMFRNAFSFSIQADGLGDGSDNAENNNKRKIRIYYNNSMIEGAIDGLRGGNDENEDYFDQVMYDNEADPMYKHAYEKTLNGYRNYILNKIKICDDRSVILAAAISKYANYYRSALEGYSSAFSGDSSRVLLSNYLDYIGDSRSIFNFYNQDQFGLASIVHKRLMFPSLNNYFLPNGKDVTSNQLKCMYKFFSCKPGESNYRNSSFISTEQQSFKQRQKKLIFHIGIPNGLVQSLRKEALHDLGFESFDFAKQTAMTAKSRRMKIIKIQLFKKDLLNPSHDVMVQEYLFDMGKFLIDGLDHDDINNSIYSSASNNISYESFVNNHYMYQVNSDLSIVKDKINKIGTINDTYDSSVRMTFDQKREIVGNHLNDYYLKTYCKTMLGIDYDEDIYQFSEVKNKTLRRGPDPGLGQNTYDSAFLLPLQQVIQLGQNNTAYLKERARIASEGERSVFFSGRKYFERTINPKLFDRVFSVFVNLHDLDEVSEDKVSLDQFYCSITLTQYQLEFTESNANTEAVLDRFNERHGVSDPIGSNPNKKRSMSR